MTATFDTDTTTGLTRVAELTDAIRTSQRNIEEHSRERRTVIVSLREKKVTYREIAEAMGTTEQNVYKILRDFIAEKNALAASAAQDG